MCTRSLRGKLSLAMFSMAAPPPLSESLSMELLQEDGDWASLASASGLADEMDDADCQALVGTVEAMAAELARRISSRMLAAKSTLAQRAQMRQAQQNAIAAEEQQRLEAMLMDEAAAREEVEARLEKARRVQHRLADALATTRDDGAARLAAHTVLAEWQRSLAAIKREAHCERLAPRHYARSLLRMCVGRWRSSARKLRHMRIDQFWERSVLELRGALQAHYQPQLEALRTEVRLAREETQAAWVAKEQQGRSLKAAFMRGVCQLNLETAGILGNTGNAEEEVAAALAAVEGAMPVPHGAPPRPMLP